MAVLLRYGATQKQRLGLSHGGSRAERLLESVDNSGVRERLEDEEEEDLVAAMVERVKTRGVSNFGISSDI